MPGGAPSGGAAGRVRRPHRDARVRSGGPPAVPYAGREGGDNRNGVIHSYHLSGELPFGAAVFAVARAYAPERR